MLSLLRQSLRIVTASVLATIFAIPPSLLAQAHVVSLPELKTQAVAASQAREHNLEVLIRFLSSGAAERAMKSIHADPRQVKTAVSNLDDRELAQLASRAQKAQAHFSAGHLTDRDLLIILVAIVALVLIIVAVHH